MGEALLVLDRLIRIEGELDDTDRCVYTPLGADLELYSDIGATMSLRMPAAAEMLEKLD